MPYNPAISRPFDTLRLDQWVCFKSCCVKVEANGEWLYFDPINFTGDGGACC